MLENILIKNVALIKYETIDLFKGLNIISGETGSGKSMFIDSIAFLLGINGKVKRDFIRHGAEVAEVEGTFYVENKELLSQLKDKDIPIDEDNMLQIKRSVNDKGKTNIKANGKTITIGTLKEIGATLVDIHMQHEHQALLSQSRHIEFLDILSNEDLAIEKDKLSIKYKEYKECEKKLEELELDEREKNLRIDMLKFQIDEIESGELKKDEEEYLITRQKILSQSEKIKINSDMIVSLLYDNDDEELSAYDKITKSISLMDTIVNADKSKSYIKESLIVAQANFEDICHDIRAFSDNLELEPNELDVVEDRLSIIFKLKKKYGNTVNEILEYYNNIKDEYEKLEDSDKIVENLKKKMSIHHKECMDICIKMTKIRMANKELIEKNIEATLKDLGMKDVRFSIDFSKKKIFSLNGIDEVSFLISTNKGQELKPLDKIASGGEMSRIMIAIKNLVSKNYSINTFIFDEIDNGVSGLTAHKVGEKLSEIGKHHQIICITHLPQIAAMSDNHLYIYKETKDDETITHIKSLEEQGEIDELSRLIGGAKITDATNIAAKEMRSMAKKIKEERKGNTD